MTKWTISINNLDISPIVNKYEYTTTRVPIYTRTIETLDGREHTRKRGERGTLTLGINALTGTWAHDLAAAILDAPCTVRYYSREAGGILQETMLPSAPTLRWAMELGGTDFYRGTEISFEGM